MLKGLQLNVSEGRDQLKHGEVEERTWEKRLKNRNKGFLPTFRTGGHNGAFLLVFRACERCYTLILVNPAVVSCRLVLVAERDLYRLHL